MLWGGNIVRTWPEESIGEQGGKLPGLAHAHTSFVGRTAGIGKVAAVLAEYRPVTVSGSGGEDLPALDVGLFTFGDAPWLTVRGSGQPEYAADDAGHPHRQPRQMPRG